MSVIQIITAVNNYVQYERYIKNNPFYRNFDLVPFDNINERLAVPVRYNHFINTFLRPDAWVMFCHQDFSVNEDLSCKLSSLDRNCIYGPVGIKSYRCTDVILRVKGPRAFTMEKKRFFENKFCGQIMQGFDGDESKARLCGEKVNRPLEVDTVDSCCLIIHSSLIREHGLRFDENFDFNLFGADFSIMARKCYNIKTKVLQLNCFHLSEGRRNVGYLRCLSRLVKKYPDEKIVLTFSDEREVDAFRYFFANENSGEVIKSFISMREDY